MLELRAVARRWRDFALGPLDLAFPDGSLTVLVGPSGAGKSTVLRVATGLERPDAGRVLLDGRDITHDPTEARGLALVFQDGALFPHLDVAGNVGFGLAAKKTPAAARRPAVEEALALVGLAGFEMRRVGTLSGGERQRVALARALAPVLAGRAPRVLLLDEPFAALDRPLREDLRRAVRALHRRLGLTTVLVTHDREEALLLADRVALLAGGRLVEAGAARDVVERPATAFAAGFLGAWNVLDGAQARALGGPDPGPGRAWAVAPRDVRLGEGIPALVEEGGWATGRAVVEAAGVRLLAEDSERWLVAGAAVEARVRWEAARALPTGP